MTNSILSAAIAWDQFDLELLVTPPENGGQIVEVDYGSDGDYIFRRVYDRSDRSTTVSVYFRDDDDDFQPWNGRPVVGEYIGDVVGPGAWVVVDDDDVEVSRHNSRQEAIANCDDNWGVWHYTWRD